MPPHDRYDSLSRHCRHFFILSRAYISAVHTATRPTHAVVTVVSMAGHPAGITVDAVREQLAALGHDDVSDDVIASFLDSLRHQVNDELAPVEKVAAGVDGAEDPPPPPPVERTDAAAARGYSPEATAARTPGGTERRPRLGPKPDDTRDGSAFREGTRNDDAVSRNRRSTPTGARPRPTSSGRRAATRTPLAIPTTTADASIRGDASGSNNLAINSQTPPSRTPTRHRREPTTPKDAHEDIIGWCAKRSVASVTPGSVTGGKTHGPRRSYSGRSTSSVIASSMPIRAGVGTPGQRVRIDRVARAAQYAAVWSGDAYLARGGVKSPASAGTSRSKLGAGRVDFANSLDDLDEATVFGTRSKLAYDRYDRYDVNGPRGGSWGRAQRKLTDGTNEWRVDVEENSGRFGSGFWNGKRAPGGKTPTGKGFKTPDAQRRDALRWEVRARMAAPPTF